MPLNSNRLTRDYKKRHLQSPNVRLFIKAPPADKIFLQFINSENANGPIAIQFLHE